MNAELFKALELIEKEKGIPREYMLEKVSTALVNAYKRDNPEAGDNVFVEVNEKKSEMTLYLEKTVVEEVEDTQSQISREDAVLVSKKLTLGDVAKVYIKTQEFGRIAAQNAKQIIIQGIREAERGIIFEEFTSKEHEILDALVSKVDPRSKGATLEIITNKEKIEVFLSVDEQIPGEELVEGDRIKVYVVEVKKSSRGPQIMISRTHRGLVKRLFELEVPEIHDGIVEIMSVAREPGSRTKMAVRSKDADVDPIGACVGPKGARVAGVVEELKGEKIDIIKYSEDLAEMVAASLAPAEVVGVEGDLDPKSFKAIVPDDQLSLAIGKEGQNARLAARLTGCKIDIKPQSNRF